MYQAQTDLTLNEVLTDPLIRAVMRADGVQMAEFKSLLHTAAGRLRQREPAKATTRQADAGSMEESLFAGRKRRLLAMIKPPGGATDAMCAGCY